MAESREDLIRLLEAELDLIEGGGYQPSSGEPGRDKPMFFHSLVCINHWMVPGHDTECHDDCVLLDAVPTGCRHEEMPCHFIPLNDEGDTVQSLEATGDRDRLEREVKKWLRTTIARLKQGGAPGGTPEVRY
jgi:hypothetical protein